MSRSKKASKFDKHLITKHALHSLATGIDFI